LKKQKNVEILARATDVEVGPLNLPSSMPPAIVVTDISQAMGTDDKTENASRNKYITRFPASVIGLVMDLEHRWSIVR
jgi:hypothetical protein